MIVISNEGTLFRGHHQQAGFPQQVFSGKDKL